MKNLVKEIKEAPESKTFQDAETAKEAKTLWEKEVNEEDEPN